MCSKGGVMDQKKFDSKNFSAVALKTCLPYPFAIMDAFGKKSKSVAPKAFKFSTKWVFIEVNNW